MKIKLFFMSLLVTVNGFLVCAQTGALQPALLRIEYRVDPSGMDETSPRLSWTLGSAINSQKQTAYRILVASSASNLDKGIGDLWDTGKTDSDQTMHIVYRGQTLTSRMAVWWKVMVWDKGGKPSGWSEPGRWTMGLLRENDWQAKWIADSTSMIESMENVLPRNGYHSTIVNRADTEQWVIIDLGKEQSFDAIKLFPAYPYDYKDTPGFLYPVRFKVEAADRWDFTDARMVVAFTKGDVPNPGNVEQRYSFPVVKGRFVKLTVSKLPLRDDDNYAFALAEMQVLKGDENLALNAPVFSVDAINMSHWKAEFLTDGRNKSTSRTNTYGALPATYARKAFNVNSSVKKATAYVSALGLYEFHLNGKKVGNLILSPEWTDYHKRISYQTYDVTQLVRQGENIAGAALGEGWYAGQLMLYGRFAYGRYPRLLVQIEIELADGTRQWVVSDETWKTTIHGPITSSGIYLGETYDARLEQTGWDKPGFRGNDWKQAAAFNLDATRLVWLRNEPIEVEMELKPKAITEPKPDVYIIDFGQNMVGWCHFKLDGIAGQTVTIRHGEAVNDDGTLYTVNLRGAPQVDYYTPRVNGKFEYEPLFTYHGFQFVEVSGLAKAPTKDDFTGKVFHSSSPLAGQFACSNESLNQLMSNILWTQRANLVSTPNDCPQRDERFGWMGDIQAFSQTGIFNMDLGAFITKFSQDVRDGQSDEGKFPDFAPHPGKTNDSFKGAPAWGDAGVFVPWTAYINYADRRLLEEQFAAAKAWVEYIHRNNPDLIWRNGRNNDYNDWLCGDDIRADGWPKTGGRIPNDVFATAFFARSTQLVAKMAAIIGDPLEATVYKQLAEQIKSAFNSEFVQPDGTIKGNTQAGYALALSFDLLPENMRSKATALMVDNIRKQYKNHLSTGIQTTHRLMQELTVNGYNELAWQLLLTRTFPSWMYMIDNGATTSWERWEGYVKGRGFQDPGMNSLNHWAFGAIGEWMWRNIVGLNPDETQPGWKHFSVAPRPGGGLTWAKGEYQSIRGRMVSDWKIEKGKFHLHVVIPPNTTATIQMPATKATSIMLDNQKIQPVSFSNGVAVIELESGDYRLVSDYKK